MSIHAGGRDVSDILVSEGLAKSGPEGCELWCHKPAAMASCQDAGQQLTGSACSLYVLEMPAVPSSNKFANRSISDCARDGMLITMRCNGCRRQVNYWAADLLEVIEDPFHEAHRSPWGCAHCRTGEYMVMRWRIPAASEMAAGLTVRRPVKKITRWIWRDEKV